MKKLFLKLLNFLNRNHITIYMIIIVFALLFYIVLKGASGHKFAITNEEKTYTTILLISFILSGVYKQKINKVFDKIVLYLLLVTSCLTLVFSLQFLYFTFTFDYGFDEGLIFTILVLFLLPVVFTWCNFYLIRNIIKKLISSFSNP